VSLAFLIGSIYCACNKEVTIHSENMINENTSKSIIPKTFSLKSKPEITRRKGSLDFVGLGRNSYKYKGKVIVDDQKFDLDIKNEPIFAVEFNKEMYLLTREFFRKEQFYWYKLKEKNIELLAEKSWPHDFSAINFQSPELDYHYKTFQLEVLKKESSYKAFDCLKAFLIANPEFPYQNASDKVERFSSFLSNLYFLKCQDNSEHELYPVFRKILLGFPDDNNDRMIEVLTTMMCKIDYKNGIKEFEEFKNKSLSIKEPELLQNREKILFIAEIPIAREKALKSDIYVKFSEFCKNNGFKDGYYKINEKDENRNLGMGVMYFNRECKKIPGTKNDQDQKIYIALHNNMGKNRYMELFISDSGLSDSFTVYNYKQMKTVKHIFSAEETIDLLNKGSIPEQIFNDMEDEFINNSSLK
jgi:hypothetical protein